MHPPLIVPGLLVAIIIFFFFFFTQPITSQEVTVYEACKTPSRCHNMDIRYPFLVRGRPSYCGYQRLLLDCEGNKSDIWHGLEWYQVKGISYANRFVTLVDKDVLRLDGCPTNSSYQSIATDFLNTDNIPVFFPGRPSIFLLTGCPQRPRDTTYSNFRDARFYEICPGVGNVANYSYWARVPDDSIDSELPTLAWARGLGCSNLVKVGLTSAALNRLNRLNRFDSDYNSSAIRDVMREGVQYVWGQGEAWCPDCENSGGVCGFSQSDLSEANQPICFCPDGSQSPSCSDHVFSLSGTYKIMSSSKIMSTPIVIGIICSILLIVILVILRRILHNTPYLKLIFLWEKNSTRKKDGSRDVEFALQTFGSLAPKRFSYKEIKKITNAFKVKLGQGGFGAVYKGKLVDGREVAVKVLTGSKGNGEEFLNEVASIGRTHHVNIVTLLGFCSEGPRRALVYEFMPNGSLEKAIYNGKEETTLPFFGWEKLLDVAVGTARGLEYLHRGCHMRILHFDIKPHNILLDNNYCPKISDFGLAKLCPNQESLVSTLTPRGTYGYIAPEVVCRNIGRVSYKSDVYSYGKMMLEMAGGRENIDVHVENISEIYFPDWVHKRLERNEWLGLENVVSDEDEKIARKMVMVGLWCIQTEPGRRPSMSKVLEMLEGDVGSIEMPPTPCSPSPFS